MRLSFFLLVLAFTFVACIGVTKAENTSKLDNGRRLRLSVEDEEERDLTSATTGILSGVKKAALFSDDQAAKFAKVLTNSNKARASLLVSDDELVRVTNLIKKANSEAAFADDEVAKLAKVFAAAQKSAKATDDQVMAIVKVLANSKKVGAVAKASDDEVRKVTEMFKVAANGAAGAAKYTDDEVLKLSKALAEAQKGAALTDKQVAKVVGMFAEAKRLDSMLSKAQVAKMSAELAPVAKADKKSWNTLKDVIVTTLGVAAGGAILYGVFKLTSPNEVSAS